MVEACEDYSTLPQHSSIHCIRGNSSRVRFVFALNDNVQQSFDVNLRLKDVPDSITFISDIPDKLHV